MTLVLVIASAVLAIAAAAVPAATGASTASAGAGGRDLDIVIPYTTLPGGGKLPLLVMGDGVGWGRGTNCKTPARACLPVYRACLSSCCIRTSAAGGCVFTGCNHALIIIALILGLRRDAVGEPDRPRGGHRYCVGL